MAGLRGAGRFPPLSPQAKTRHVPDSMRASLKHIIIENDVSVYWLLSMQPTLSGPAAQGDSQEEMHVLGHLMRPLNYTTCPVKKTEPSMMSLHLLDTTLEIIRGFYQPRTGACRQKPGPIQPIQRKVIPKRIVINVGQAKCPISRAASPVACPVRRSISPFPPKQYLLFSAAVAMGEVAKGEDLQCRETGRPESPLDQPDELPSFRCLSCWPDVKSGGV